MSESRARSVDGRPAEALAIEPIIREHEFQNVAKLRLNVLYAGSIEGAHRAHALLAIIAMWRTLGVLVQAYLAWACERLGSHRDVFALPLEAMTPVAFKKTLG